MAKWVTKHGRVYESIIVSHEPRAVRYFIDDRLVDEVEFKRAVDQERQQQITTIRRIEKDS